MRASMRAARLCRCGIMRFSFRQANSPRGSITRFHAALTGLPQGFGEEAVLHLSRGLRLLTHAAGWAAMESDDDDTLGTPRRSSLVPVRPYRWRSVANAGDDAEGFGGAHILTDFYPA
jgi:hypothetical protein